jgi:hypothetical protein
MTIMLRVFRICGAAAMYCGDSTPLSEYSAVHAVTKVKYFAILDIANKPRNTNETQII